MKLTFEQGNLITEFKKGRFDFIAHQANCCGLMKSGIASFLTKEFPSLGVIDKKFCDSKDVYGDYLLFATEFGNIVNLYGQYFPGGCSLKEGHLDHYAMRCQKLSDALKELISNYEIKELGIPLVASGLAADPVLKGQNTDLWYFKEYVKWIFEEAFKDTQTNITVIYL